jgi:hypothetical protein
MTGGRGLDAKMACPPSSRLAASWAAVGAELAAARILTRVPGLFQSVITPGKPGGNP